LVSSRRLFLPEKAFDLIKSSLSVFGFFHHVDGFGGAFFSTDAASLTILQINLNWNISLNDSLGTIEPTKIARRTVLLAGRAFGIIYLGSMRPPVSCSSAFTFAQLGMGVFEGVLFGFGHKNFLFY
jgi:hypothetical protein